MHPQGAREGRPAPKGHAQAGAGVGVLGGEGAVGGPACLPPPVRASETPQLLGPLAHAIRRRDITCLMKAITRCVNINHLNLTILPCR